MTLTKLIENLTECGTTLTECGSHPVLDLGQKQMIAEAEVRVAQTVRELTMFDAEHEYVGNSDDIAEAEENGWTH